MVLALRKSLALLFLIVSMAPLVQTSIGAVDRSALLSFLRSQYVPSVGLLRAAVNAHPDNVTIYIANDNILASRALAVLGDHELASRITSKLDSEYGGGYNGRIEVLLGIDIPDRFYTPVYELIGEVEGYRIVYEKSGGEVVEDWHKYADLLVYRALDSLLRGSRPHSEILFLNLTMMWDGYGFRDKAFSGVYATYKCGLFVYLYRALEASGSSVVYGQSHIKDKCIEIISAAQDPTGGIRTDYRVVNGSVVIEGDANVETTSIVILALYSDYPIQIAKRVRQPSPTAENCDYAQVMGVLILAIAIMTLLPKLLLRRI